MFYDDMKTEETKTPETTKEKIVSLLKLANDYVWMSTGLNAEFYNDSEVKAAMVDAFKRVNRVRVLISGDIEDKKEEVMWFFDLVKELDGKIQVRQCAEVLHWVISDGKHFRLERPHKVEVVGVNNLLVYDVSPPVISDILKRRFDEWWDQSNTIEP